jgi:predicted dehydrogenase
MTGLLVLCIVVACLLASLNVSLSTSMSISPSTRHLKEGLDDALLPVVTKHDVENKAATHSDWFDADEWNNSPYTDSCLVLDDICHASNRWFFRPGSPHYETRNESSHLNILLQNP